MEDSNKYKFKKIKLTKLFNAFNHTIEINKNKGITLVLGENGLGKTVILKLLKQVFEGNFINLKNYEFERLDLFFEDFKYSFFGTVDDENLRLIAKKYKGKTVVEEFDFLNINYSSNFAQGSLFLETTIKGNKFENDFIRSSYIDPDEIDYLLRKYIGRFVKRIRKNEWRDLETGEILHTNSIIKKYRNRLPKRFDKLNIAPEWLKELSDRINVYIIETQRLRTRKGSENYIESITDISQELAQTIKGLLAQANEFATQLDRTYPTRLLTKINDPETITETDLSQKLAELDNRRKRLKEVGLVEPFEDDIQRNNLFFPHRGDNEPDRIDLINNVLLVYIQDSNEKLNIYEKIADKLEVFINILNERLNVKRIQIDKEKGLDIKSTKVDEKPSKLNPNNSKKKRKQIPLTGLSSGEQHMIILFYNLLFKCEENSLILIDEPEISLHIGWQNKFIEDLNRIKKINPFEAIIATHSPDIINDNWDLTVELNED
ncbi:AAA family ATPase [Aquimarina sp. AU119]|uniref:AAA family ATPase n=1 Tax=Aquimarina sp. AU119 TaxID=2108528 RepID=UPI000D68E88B|nr:AAA family ATPase [Aquimarina sp. AU119]